MLHSSKQYAKKVKAKGSTKKGTAKARGKKVSSKKSGIPDEPVLSHIDEPKPVVKKLEYALYHPENPVNDPINNSYWKDIEGSKFLVNIINGVAKTREIILAEKLITQGWDLIYKREV